MPFNRPTLQELIDRIRNDLLSRLDINDPLRRADAVTYSMVDAGSVHGLYGYIEWLSKQFIYDTADADILERWADIWGIFRKAATQATGTVTLTLASGATVPLGTQLVAFDGVVYETLAAITYPASVADIQAVTAGSNGNRTTGQTLTLVSPIAGVNSTGTASALTGGTDIENDADLRTRLIARVQEPPHGGNAADYVNWALAVAGVTRAWCYPLESGIGTVVVRFMMDNAYADGIPLAGDVTTVQAYLDELRPATAALSVVAPVADALNFTISVTPNTADVQAAVETELKDLILREGQPGGTILLSHINGAISLAAGETDHVLSVPAADVVSPTGHIPVFGTITFI